MVTNAVRRIKSGVGKLGRFILLLLAFTGFNALAISAPSITSCTRLSDTSVRISWTSVSGAVQYRVASQHGSGGTWYYDTTTATTFTDTYATVQSCSYYVIAIDSTGATAKSSTVSVAASGSGGSSGGSSGGESGGGSSSGSFTINASDGTSTVGVAITWSAQSGATKYRVVRGTTSTFSSAEIIDETSETAYLDTDASAGKTYYYWVVAVKSSGNITSSYNTGYRASSSSGGGSGSGSGTSYDGQPYTVKFNANGGTGSMANESFVYGTAKALTINTFTRTGYIFVGWATSASATTSTYDDGQSVKDLTTTSGGTVNLYAVWQANTYTVKFNKNGGTGTMANETFTYGVAKALTANAFQRVNYKFVGWATSASATTATYSNKQSVSNLTATLDGTVNLYAVWKLVLEVTSVTARQRYPWNGLVDIDVTFAASGLSTVSFEVKDTKGNTNLTARTFYVGNPSENNRTLEVQPGTRRFVWDAFADLGQVTLSSFAVTAKVAEKNFQVNVTGGTGSGSFVQGKSVTISAASKTGYTFASWSGTTADTGILASATSASTTLTIPSRDVAYEATYTPNTYTVKFNANGGSGTMPVESFTYDVSKALTANAFTRNGWTFKGWAESADATAAKYTNGQSVKNLATSGTKNLYAVWSVKTFSVKFNANGGNGTMANESFTYGIAKTLTGNVFTRSKYVFMGWSMTANGSVTFNDKQSVANLSDTDGATVNLYAVWGQPQYMVIDLSGGPDATSYPIAYYDEPPSGGFNTYYYATTNLVLKRITEGSFYMGTSTANESYRVTLTKPFYMGIFEVTRRQCALIMGWVPSNSRSTGACIPAYSASYDMIRGSSKGAKWPSSSAVDDSSIIGTLRAKTGLNFDLPTEAQWEYACRAGTSTQYSYGDSSNGAYMWYSSNSDGDMSSVGTKLPNPWGLYDMHGNLCELTLNWYSSSITYGTDPKGPSTGSTRVARGGDWHDSAARCTSFYRAQEFSGGSGTYTGVPPSKQYITVGFRIVLTLQ